MLNDNMIIGEKDPEISRKIAKLREELRQVQVQLVDVPVEMATDMTEKELNDYFNSSKVTKKYRMNKK
jgi:cob(I)alamin adenosyltransferase